MISWLRRFLTEPAGDESRPIYRDVPFSPTIHRNPSYRFDDASTRIAVIGDLHGRIDLMQRLAPDLDRFAGDTSKSFIEIYLGDYVDRGANPRAVIDFLAARSQLTDRRVICLAGNHEQMFLAALDSDDEFRTWFGFGGQSTLASYGVSAVDASKHVAASRAALNRAIPPAHVAFLSGLSMSYEHGGFFFTHAGVRPGIALDLQEERDLLWIRQPFLNTQANLGAIVVHGHTPTPNVTFRPNRIGVDTGAYRTGILTALIVTSEAIDILDTRRSPGRVR